MFNGWSIFTTSPVFTINVNPAGTICDVVVPVELTIVTLDSFFSVVVISEIKARFVGIDQVAKRVSPCTYEIQ